MHDDEAEALKAVQAGADPNFQCDGMPLLVIAAAEGQEKLVDALLKAGADPNAQDAFGRSAIMYVGWLGSTEAHERIFDELVGHGARLNERQREGGTVLDLATRFLNTRMVPKLVAYHAECSPESRRLAERIISGHRSWGRGRD